MKKLIMLSVFALGTITASASNDLFKNYFEAPQQQVLWKYHIYITQINTDFTSSVLLDTVTECMTEQSFSYTMFVIHEQYVLNSPNPNRVFISTSRSICW